MRVGVAALVTVILTEGAVRVLGPRLGSPLDWYTPIAQVKDGDLDELDAPPDIVVVGSSMSFQGVRTTQLCVGEPATVYNAALPGGFPRVVERWLDDAVLSHGAPSVVVWGLSPFDTAGTLLEVEASAEYERSRAGRSGLLGELERRAASVSELIRYRAELRDPLAVLRQLPRGGEDALDEAYRDVLPCGDSSFFRQVVDQFQFRGTIALRPDPSSIAAIERVLETMASENIAVYLLELPISPVALADLGEEAYEEYQRLVADLAATTNAEVIRPGVPFSVDDFNDIAHLGPEGADRLTDDLARQLEERGALSR